MRNLSILLVVAALALGASPVTAQRVAEIEVRTRQFPSGLRVVVAKTPAVPGRKARAYVTTYVDQGSLQETELARSHLIEHIVANSVPTIQLPVLPAETEVFASNALTKPNFLSFVRTVSPESLEPMIYNRLARIGRVAPTEAIFLKERGRVVEELERGISLSPDFVAWKALEAHASGKPPSLAAEIGAARTATQAATMGEMAQAFVPERAVLVVAGDIDPAASLAAASRAVHLLQLDRPSGPTRARGETVLDLSRAPVTIAQNPREVYVAALGFLQPDPTSSQYPAFLVLDQLLMGGRDITEKGAMVARSAESPLGRRLHNSLGATKLWDGREQAWGVAPWAEGQPSLYTILFRTPSAIEAAPVAAGVEEALHDIRATGMSDEEIVAAREKLATFYENWLLEPTYRILGDHLAAFAFLGRDPAAASRIPQLIRAVSPEEVRNMMDRQLLGRTPLVALTVPAEAEAP